jgi:hypothetical protein
MRDFILSDITGGNKAPFSKRSLEHINAMPTEVVSGLFSGITNITNFGSEFVIISGCVITGPIPGVITWSSGYVYYQGNIYPVDAGGTTINIGQTAVWNYADTTITGDPATFSDTNTYDFHRIRKMTITSAASGSGLKNYDSVKIYNGAKVNGFGTITPSAPVSAATITEQAFLRRGNRMDFFARIDVTTSTPADLFDLLIPITYSDDYPFNDPSYYNTVFNSIGTVTPVYGSLSGEMINGYVQGNFVGNVFVRVYRTDLATSHSIGISGSYFTNKPYSPY